MYILILHMIYFNRAKHPITVHIWAGISCKGPTQICIFEGIMGASLYSEILCSTLLPFLSSKLPMGHYFMQDNNPKHVSRLAKDFFRDNNINWRKTPSENPDTNPIENLWHELKEFICCEVKPRTKQQLVYRIKAIWSTVHAANCTFYIRHLC